jgi:hypothetical protein
MKARGKKRMKCKTSDSAKFRSWLALSYGVDTETKSSEFLAANPEVLGWVPGATRFSK